MEWDQTEKADGPTFGDRRSRIGLVGLPMIKRIHMGADAYSAKRERGKAKETLARPVGL